MKKRRKSNQIVIDRNNGAAHPAADPAANSPDHFQRNNTNTVQTAESIEGIFVGYLTTETICICHPYKRTQLSY